MNKKAYFIFFIIEVGIVLLASSFQKTPGYMDADYYFANALQISSAKGFQEPFLWNYLDDPIGISHPAFTYWMPLASLISSLFLFIFNSNAFWVARIPLIFLSGFVPVLTMHIISRLGGERRVVLISGALSILSGFYLLYLGLPETFLLYMLLGGCFIEIGITFTADNQKYSVFTLSIALGLIAGLLHLTRADGLIWVAAGGALIIWVKLLNKHAFSFKKLATSILLYSLGYLLIMGFWYFRNISVLGSLFPTGGAKTLWLIDYNQTFIYPSSKLSFSEWWNIGLIQHIKIYLSSLWANFLNVFIVQGEIFLLPLMILGFISYRSNTIVKFFFWVFLTQFIFSTIVFPFSGARGGFFHSGSAFQIVLWGMAGTGFWIFLDWGYKKRRWNYLQSVKVFTPALILLTLLLSGGAYLQKVIGNFQTPWIWDKENAEYVQIEKLLLSKNIDPNIPILIKNPPGYFISTGRSAVVIPDGDASVVLQVAQKYHSTIMALDKDHVPAIDSIYSLNNSISSIKLLDSIGDYKIFLLNTK